MSSVISLLTSLQACLTSMATSSVYWDNSAMSVAVSPSISVITKHLPFCYSTTQSDCQSADIRGICCTLYPDIARLLRCHIPPSLQPANVQALFLEVLH